MTAVVSEKYQWQGDSCIQRMEILVTAAGELRARIFANPQQYEKAAAIPLTLHKQGFAEGYADIYEGQNVLIIPDIKEADKLVKAINEAGFVDSSTPVKHEDFNDNDKAIARRSLLRSLQRDTLQWSGKVGLAGHIALIGSGVAQRDWSRVIAGPLGMVSPIVLGAYGNGKGAIKIDRLIQGMHKHFAENGAMLATTNTDDLEQDPKERLNNFIADHSIQFAFGTGALGAGALLNSGLEEIKRARNPDAEASEKTAGLGRFLASSATLMGDMIAVFVGEEDPNKAHIQGEKKSSGLLSWIRKSPLMFHGILNYANNLLLVYDAFQEKRKISAWRSPQQDTAIEKQRSRLDALRGQELTPEVSRDFIKASSRLSELEHQKDISNKFGGKASPTFSFITALSFLAATTLSTLSSKRRHEDYLSEEAFEPLYAELAAELLRIPPNQHSHTIEKMANYLCNQDELKEGNISKEKFAREISKRIAILDSSPWLDHPRSNSTSKATEKQDVDPTTASTAPHMSAKNEFSNPTSNLLKDQTHDIARHAQQTLVEERPADDIRTRLETMRDNRKELLEKRKSPEHPRIAEPTEEFALSF